MTAARSPARLAQLLVGFVLFGVGLWLGLVAELGVGPWDVLTGGLAELLGTSVGRTSVVVSVIVLLVGMAAGVRPGIGTLLDVVVIGATIDLLLASPLLTWLGDGPSVLRVAVVLLGIGTVLFAFGIGPAVQVVFRLLRQSPVRPAVAVAA